MNKEAFDFKKFLGQISGGVDTVMNPVPSAKLPFSPTSAAVGLGTMAKVLPSPVSPILAGVSAIGELAGLGANGVEGTLDTLSKKYEDGGPINNVFTGLKQPIGSLMLGGKKLLGKLKYDPTVGFPNSTPIKGMGSTSPRYPQPTVSGRPQTYASALKGGQLLMRMGNKTAEPTLDLLVKAAREYLKKKKEKRRLDPKCWEGYRKDGTKIKDGVRVNDCVKVGGVPFEFLLKAAIDPTPAKFNLLSTSENLNPNHPADRPKYNTTTDYDKPLNWEKIAPSKISDQLVSGAITELKASSLFTDLLHHANPKDRKIIDELGQYIYHGANSNMNSSMFVEGERSAFHKDLAERALRANPYNSMFLDVHGSGEPNQYRMSMSPNAMPTDEEARRTGSGVPQFSPGHLQKAIGDKSTNVHNLYFMSCNQGGGCGPTPEILGRFPDATNIVAHPPGKLGYQNQMLFTGLGLPLPDDYRNSIQARSKKKYGNTQDTTQTWPLQYLKGTNGTWTTNKFMGFPPQQKPDGTWTPGVLSQPAGWRRRPGLK